MSKVFAFIVLSGGLIMHVSNSSASSISISTDQKTVRAGDINKLVDKLIKVNQSVSELVMNFKDPGVSSRVKTMLVESSKPMLARMSDDLVLIKCHKAQSPEGSNLYKIYRETQLDALANKVEADYAELKNLSNKYENNNMLFSPDTKREDGGRKWIDEDGVWK